MLLAAVVALLAVALARVLWRAFAGPLASLPTAHWSCGLSLAWRAFSGLDGTLPYRLLAQHRSSGSRLIRYGPNHVSVCTTIESYRQIYSPNPSTFLKDPVHYGAFVCWTSITQTDPAIHRNRRQALSPMFSRRSLLSTEPLLKAKTDLLIGLLHKRGERGQSSNLLGAFRQCLLDVITKLAWGESYDALGRQLEEDFGLPFFRALDSAAPSVHLREVWPGLFHWLGETLPTWAMPQDMRDFNAMEGAAADVYRAYRARRSESTGATLFDHLESGKKDGQPENEVMAVAEALLVLVAGMDTTALTLAATTFALTVVNPGAGERLIAELDAAAPTVGAFEALSLQELEALPFLGACVREGLRWSDPAPPLLPRVVPTGGAVIEGVFLPGGTIVASSSVYIHHDPTLFPDPLAYKPERWLDANGQLSHNLDACMVRFGKGPRACIGKDLAQLEATLVLAHVFRRCRLTPVDETPVKLEFREHFTGSIGHCLPMLVRPRV